MRLLSACPNGQTRPGQLLSSARLLQPDLGETAERGIFFGVSSIRYRSRPPIIAFGGPRSDVPLTHGWLLPGFSPPLRHRPSGFLPTVGASVGVSRAASIPRGTDFDDHVEAGGPELLAG